MVRDLSKFSKKMLNRFSKIYKYDLNEIEKLESFKTKVKYSKIIFFQAEDGIRDLVRSRGLGDVYKRQSRDCLSKDLPNKKFNLSETDNIVLTLSLIHI